MIRQATATVRRCRAIAFAITALFAAPDLLRAQPTTGTVQGTVSDPSGGRIAGADVTLTNETTSVTQRRRADNTGQFSFSFVAPGLYVLTVTADPFRSYRAESVAVHVATTTAVPVTMELGRVGDTVTVEESPPRRLEPALTTIVEGSTLRMLPSATRSSLEVAALAPGVMVVGGSSQVIGVEGGTVIANGHRRSQSSYYVDGAENAGAWRNTVLQIPNPDTIDEVQIQSASASVQFGKQPGAALNFVTRSGTNDVHGTAFYFAHDEHLNANSWINNRNGLAKPPDNQRFLGAVAGGPIRKGRAFFFASLNHYADNLPTTQQSGRFPTERLKGGDFSEVPAFVRPDGSVVPFDIKDPVTGVSVGTRIPLDRQSPAARQLLSLLPTANTYYDTAVRQFDKPTRNHEYLAKIDYTPSSQRLSGLLLHTRGRELDPSQGFAANVTPEWGELRRLGRQTTAFVKHTVPLSSSWLLESRASLVQSSSDILPQNSDRGPADVGIAFPWTPPISQLPGLRLDGQGGFRADHANTDYIGQRNHRVGATVIYAASAHRVTAGAESQVDMVRFDVNRDLRTSFSFTGRDTLNGPIAPSQVPLSANNFGTQNFAYAWADFLLGRVTSFNTAGRVLTESRLRSSSLFAEDSWTFHPRAALTAGLRYELAGHMSERFGQAGGVFIADHQSTRFPNAPLGVAWAGDAGVPRGLIDRDIDNFAPHLGVSYDIGGDGRTILRSAVGRYFSLIPLASRINSGTSGFGGATVTGANALLDDPYGTSRVNLFDPAPQYGAQRPLPDPVVGYTPETFPWESLFSTQIVKGQPTRVFIGNLVGFDPHVETPSSLQFTVAIERQLTAGWSATAAYVGTRAHHQPMWRAMNAPQPMPGGDLSAQSLRDRRPLPTYGAGRLYATILDTQYDALQLSSTWRLQMLTASASYEVARNLSPFGINATGADVVDLFGFSTGSSGAEAIFDTASGAGQSTYPYDIERDRAEIGRRHSLKVHYVVRVPAPPQDDWKKHLLENWAVAGTLFAASGLPMNVLWGLDANADGSAADRPNLVGPIRYERAIVADAPFDRRGAIQVVDAGTFTGPCGTMARTGAEAFCTTPGDLPRNALRGVPVFGADVALVRAVTMSGNRRIEVRVEGFNVTNTNFLAPPTLDLSSPFFGQVLGRIHRPRRIQVGAKLYF